MSVISLRYANALAAVATTAKFDVVAAQQQLEDFYGTLVDSRQLREVLMNPSLSGEQKLRVLDAISAKIGMFPQIRNFVAVIVDHQRLDELHEILQDYAAVTGKQSGLTEAEITSAHPLGDAERQMLEDQPVKLAGGAVHPTYRQDSTLLGGAVVRIGSTVYDGSIRAQLTQLKHKLVSA